MESFATLTQEPIRLSTLPGVPSLLPGRKQLERRRLRVYLAGPISQGDVLENVTNAIKLGKRMVKDGLAPYIPHFDSYMFPGNDISWNAFLEWDLEWLPLCEAVFRITGESEGADKEVEVARELSIPVFYSYSQLLAFADDMGLTGKRR